MEDDETIWNSLECCRFYDERLRSTANMLGHPIIIISFHVKSIKLSWNMYDIVYTSNKQEHHWASLYTYLDWYCSGSSGGSEFTLGNWMCRESSNSFQFQCSSGRFGPRRLLIGFMSTSCQRSSRQKAGIWTTSLAECSKSSLFVFALGFSTAFGTVASLLLLPWRLHKRIQNSISVSLSVYFLEMSDRWRVSGAGLLQRNLGAGIRWIQALNWVTPSKGTLSICVALTTCLDFWLNWIIFLAASALRKAMYTQADKALEAMQIPQRIELQPTRMIKLMPCFQATQVQVFAFQPLFWLGLSRFQVPECRLVSSCLNPEPRMGDLAKEVICDDDPKWEKFPEAGVKKIQKGFGLGTFGGSDSGHPKWCRINMSKMM